MHPVSRRTLLGAAAGAAFVGLTPGSARAATEGWWHTPGYTVGNSGFSQHETTILASTVGRVTAKGTLLSGSTRLGAPVLDKGRLFAADATGITALAESTGARLWRYDFPHPIPDTARIVIRDGVLTAAWNNDPAAPVAPATVMTLDAATGTRIAEADITENRFEEMLVDRDHVVLTLWNHRAGLNSRVLRQSDLQYAAWSPIREYLYRPVSANGRLLLRSSFNETTSIRDLTTGGLVWSVKGPQFVALAANDAGTRFYVAWGHSLQVVDSITGVTRWLASNVNPREVTVTGSRLYVSHGNSVSVFDAATDRPVYWTKAFSAEPLKPIIAGGVLYVTVPGDRVHVLDPVTGNPITTAASTGATAMPVITNGIIYLTDGTKITKYGL